jgi:hypothetical protein
MARGIVKSGKADIPTFLHSYIPTFLHSYIPTFLHSYIPTFYFATFYLHAVLLTLAAFSFPAFEGVVEKGFHAAGLG